MAMHVEVVPSKRGRPAILIRHSYREDGKVKKRTIANISDWTAERVAALRRVLRSEPMSPELLAGGFEITRSIPHGHAVAVVHTVRSLGLDRILGSKPSRQRQIIIALIAARVLSPRSKLATARELDDGTLSNSLAQVLGIEPSVDVAEIYEAMDWLLTRQETLENALAKRHLQEGTFVLYDLTSTYFEGRGPPMAKRGYSRDGKSDKVQVEFGLLCDKDGCPVAVEVFDGNVADPKTVASQIAKLRDRFNLSHIVFVGDRGMLTNARISKDLPDGYEWITALRAPAIKRLVKEGSLQLALFEQKRIAEITDPRFPGERLIVCRNHRLADERRRKRIELLDATERRLDKIVAATKREKRALRGKDAIGLRVGRLLNRFKMGKHFHVEIREDGFAFRRKNDKIEAEGALDGFYIVRTNVSPEVLDTEEVVGAYKSLSSVERAFRSIKTVDLKVRPIFHRLDNRVRAHILLCTLAYYVEWNMRRNLAPILFDDHDPEEANLRDCVVDPSIRSEAALRKAKTKRTPSGRTVHSFRTLLSDLSTIAINTIERLGFPPMKVVTTPTPAQKEVLDLLGVRL